MGASLSGKKIVLRSFLGITVRGLFRLSTSFQNPPLNELVVCLTCRQCQCLVLKSFVNRRERTKTLPGGGILFKCELGCA